MPERNSQGDREWRIQEDPEPPRRKFIKTVLAATGLAATALTVGRMRKHNESGGEIKNSKSAKENAIEILTSGDVERFLDNPYVVSALYYSDTFLQSLDVDSQTEPTLKIIAEIKSYITPQVRAEYIQMLNKKFESNNKIERTRKLIAPLSSFSFGGGDAAHPDAIDLFTDEGSNVASISEGVVVLAENGWVPENKLSTSSIKGGNTVIVYNPNEARFYRYAHLEKVDVKTGEVIPPGESLGTVGHTGINASKLGHGGHLHLEANNYIASTGRMQITSNKKLKEEVIKYSSR